MRPAFIAIRRVGVPFLIVTSFLLGSLVGFTKVLLGFTGFRIDITDDLMNFFSITLRESSSFNKFFRTTSK